MSEESSFEQVELDDLESVAGDEPKLSSMEYGAIEQKIVFELPEAFLQDTERAQNDGFVHSCSGSSSFLPVKKLGEMKIEASQINEKSCEGDGSKPAAKRGEDWSQVGSTRGDDESSKWTHVRQESLNFWNSTTPTEASVAASSTISGFDLISLSGACKRRCKRCSFVNGDEDGLCKGCGMALLTNPCLELDGQIAKNMQLTEEELAFESVISDEKKRKSLRQQSLFVQAQALTSDITRFVETCKIVSSVDNEKMGYCTLPSAVILASRFIEFVNNGYHPFHAPVHVCFHFSLKYDWRMTQIRQDGFGPNAIFSSSADAALRAACDQPMKQSLKRLSSSAYPLLEAIPENEAASASHEATFLGWIAATVERSEEGSDLETPTTFSNPSQTFPLVCFDASLRDHDIVRRLVHGLHQVCNDFFLECASIEGTEDVEEASPSQCKKQKGPGDDLTKALVATDAAIAIALQESLYELGADVTDEALAQLFQTDFDVVGRAVYVGEATVAPHDNEETAEAILCTAQSLDTNEAVSGATMDAAIAQALQEYESEENATDI